MSYRERRNETVKSAVCQSLTGVLIALVLITAYHWFQDVSFILELNTLLWMIGVVLGLRVPAALWSQRRQSHV